MAPTTFPEKPRAPPAGLPSFWSNKADGRYWHLADLNSKAEDVGLWALIGRAQSTTYGLPMSSK